MGDFAKDLGFSLRAMGTHGKALNGRDIIHFVCGFVCLLVGWLVCFKRSL